MAQIRYEYFRLYGTRYWGLSHCVYFSCHPSLSCIVRISANSIAGPSQAEAKETRLVQALGGRHGSLDGKTSNVLPALLEKRDKVVDGQHDVGNKLLLSHLDVADGDTHAENLLELELDGALNLVDTAGKIIGVRDGGRELSGLGQTRTQETGNLLDKSLGSDESVVLAGELLDELLVLVKLLQVVGGHGVNTLYDC